ncbi:MAG: hypothetical protein JSV91_10155, partial [Phycisphaerales bacterium]
MNVLPATGHERFKFADSDALLDKANDLGVDIPFTDDVCILLEPIEIGGRTVANRIVIQPMEGRDGTADGSPGELTSRRYERFAAGGSGIIWFEATAVIPDGRAGPNQLCIQDANLGGFRKLVEQTRLAARQRFGSSHEPLLVLQLTHSGRYAKPTGTPKP